mmetsp:Transcript_15875/g.23216  ORF Transcript_15875/g.23216 Transcript_15875/m.23216 type:complete len:81 (-) Transcript_15875:1051-1293(-)
MDPSFFLAQGGVRLCSEPSLTSLVPPHSLTHSFIRRKEDIQRDRSIDPFIPYHWLVGGWERGHSCPLTAVGWLLAFEEAA